MSSDRIPAIVRVNVEPDPRVVDRVQREPWHVFEALQSMCGRFRAALAAGTGVLTSAVKLPSIHSSAPPPIELEPPRFKPGNVRYYVSDWIERLTGARPFEFRNYTLV